MHEKRSNPKRLDRKDTVILLAITAIIIWILTAI